MKTPWILSLAVLYGNGQSVASEANEQNEICSHFQGWFSRSLIGGSCLMIVSSAAFHGNKHHRLTSSELMVGLSVFQWEK